MELTPRQKAELTIKALAERKKAKEKDADSYEAHRTGIKKAIKFKTGVFR